VVNAVNILDFIVASVCGRSAAPNGRVSRALTEGDTVGYDRYGESKLKGVCVKVNYRVV
jgi:hypothetical protein